MNIKKILATLALGIGLVAPFASPSSAAIMADDYKYKDIPNWSYDLTGTLTITKEDSTSRINAYGQSYLNGFYNGTAPVDSAYVRVTGCIQGSCLPSASQTKYLGQNVPQVWVDLGPNDWSTVYSATGSHNVKENGVTYSTTNTTVQW